MDVGVGLWAMRATARLPASHSRLYAELVEDARLAEGLGFHSVWIAEHHFWYDGWCPAPLVAAASVLGATTRLHVGSGIALLPMHDPQALVGQALGLHELSGGRLELGVGLGYRDAEFDGFGLARRDRGRRMEAGLAELAARREAGTATPRVWVGGMAPAAIQRAVRHGHGLLLPQTLTLRQLRAALEQVEGVSVTAGRPRPPVAVLRHAWVTDGSAAGADRAREAVGWTQREYMGAWFLLKGSPGFDAPELLERQVGRAVDAALIGTAEQVSCGVEELAAAGIDLLVLHLTSDGERVDHRANMRAIAADILPAVGAAPA
jgi:alkanesulfonate monooxygenase SsuD/methylene tetrahydromethanopterin reductase-like flavin-dependent oxidoreductase (luciferase family)